ncbi:MAG: hypothetical protein FWC26_08840 [Fibromonadales bacterium]|nr:hypothetical protein [Fibromonadales bacterium]
MSSVEGTNLFNYTKEAEGRKVSYSTSGGNKVVNEGDTTLFKKADEAMGKDQFLTLLVAQLQYQDPLNPAEDTQFVAQLAQFSQLEFTQNSTAAISSLAENMQAFMDMQNMQAQSITNASATPLLGKEVRVMETSFDYSGMDGREFNIHLTEGNKNGTVLIKDPDGNVVAEIDVSADSIKGGDVEMKDNQGKIIPVKWDGLDKDTGNKCLGGKYTIEVMNATGAKAAGYAYKDGIVSGVSFNAGGAALTINDSQFGLGYLVNVKDPEKV